MNSYGIGTLRKDAHGDTPERAGLLLGIKWRPQGIGILHQSAARPVLADNGHGVEIDISGVGVDPRNGAARARLKRL